MVESSDEEAAVAATGPVKGVLDFSGFPKLKIKSNDVAGSWKRFCRKFVLQVEIKRREVGTKLVNAEQKDIFDEDSKLLALLSSIGEDGDDVLTAVGLSWGDGKITYESAMDTLKSHFAREDSIFVRTQKYVLVSQTVGEDQRDYLKRVERLSRDLEFFNDSDIGKHEALQTARASLTLALAVNGLRDKSLRKELMSKTNLTWKRLNEILHSRTVAVESNEKIAGAGNNASVDEPKLQPIIKTEPTNVDFVNKKSYSPGRKNVDFKPNNYPNQGQYRSYSPRPPSPRQLQAGCFSCGRPGHIAKFCPSTLCYKCGEYGHIANVCPKAMHSPGKGQPGGGKYVGIQNFKQSYSPSRSQSSYNQYPSTPYNSGQYYSPSRSQSSHNQYPNTPNSGQHYNTNTYPTSMTSQFNNIQGNQNQQASHNHQGSHNQQPSSPYLNGGRSENPGHFIQSVQYSQTPNQAWIPSSSQNYQP